MDHSGDNNLPNGKQLHENHTDTDPGNKQNAARDYNSIHKDTTKERQRRLTQTSDRTVIHVKEKKSNFKQITQCPDLFTKETLHAKVPITKWLPKYDVSCLVSDAIAGITVGLTVIPQGIAYAGVAELPPQVNILLIFFFFITQSN
jgi:hypothetical protein